MWYNGGMNENASEPYEEKKTRKDGTLLPNYTPEEEEYRSKLIFKMQTARDEREAPHAEFDGMTYSQYYDTNKRADMSYIPPKRNKNEKRIVTGYTREKDSTLLSALLSYNFKPDITAYDNTDMIFPTLGNSMEDLVLKSREIEQYGNIRALVYRELIAQGAVFVEEVWNIQRIPSYDTKGNWKPGMKIKDANFTESVTPHVIERAEIKLHEGKNVYLGDFYQMDYKKQELIFTYEIIPRGLAKSMYGTWDRWECVPHEVDNTIIQENTGGTVYADWNLTRTNKDQVGVLKVQCPFSNKYMIFLNGVMMLPTNFPLTEVSPQIGTPTLSMGILEGINGCAYGKGQPAKTKVDQAVHDEFLQLMILAEQQARMPTMGSRRKIMNPDIYTPGKILNNMKENDLFPILPESTRLNTADFSMFQLIKQMIDDKTINATFAGEEGQGTKTATQIVQEKQQQLLKLGLNFDAVKNLEADMVWRRIGNIVLNYPKSVSKKANKEKNVIDEIYRVLSMEGTLEDGKNGVKVYEFTNSDFPEPRDQQLEEEMLAEHYGKPVQKTYLNARNFIDLLKYRWIVNIIPSQETSDAIEKELFIGNIVTAKELFPGQVNDEYAKEVFAVKIKEDPSRFFLSPEQMQVDPMAQALGAPAAVGQQGNALAKAGATGGLQVKQPQITPVR
jgi:hypothetical protein